ncbi:unnamed protein product [Aphanomyces euteiches]
MESSTLRAALESSKDVEDERFLYEKHALISQREVQFARAKARAEHYVKSVEAAYERTIAEAAQQYEKQCEQLKQAMGEEILNELKILRETRDGVTLLRKGLARSARTSRSNETTSSDPNAPNNSTSSNLDKQTLDEGTGKSSDGPIKYKTARLRYGELDAIVGPLSSSDSLHDIQLIQSSIRGDTSPPSE